MRTSSVKALALAVVATVVGVIGFASPSFASSTPGSRTLPVSWESVAGDQLAVVYLDGAWTLGDCTLSLGNKVTLNLTQGWLVWDGNGTTAKTNNGDIWHSVFTFKEGGSARTVRVGTLDSPKMFPHPDHRADVWTDIRTGISIPPTFTPFTVVWDSAC